MTSKKRKSLTSKASGQSFITISEWYAPCPLEEAEVYFWDTMHGTIPCKLVRRSDSLGGAHAAAGAGSLFRGPEAVRVSTPNAAPAKPAAKKPARGRGRAKTTKPNERDLYADAIVKAIDLAVGPGGKLFDLQDHRRRSAPSSKP
jgi:hypothetical protein